MFNVGFAALEAIFLPGHLSEHDKVPQILVLLLPQSWKTTIGRFVPMEAGSQIFSQHHEPGALGPWTGFAVFALYAATALVAAFLLINRRDA